MIIDKIGDHGILGIETGDLSVQGEHDAIEYRALSGSGIPEYSENPEFEQFFEIDFRALRERIHAAKFQINGFHSLSSVSERNAESNSRGISSPNFER